MECGEARERLATQPAEADGELRAHLASCAGCRREEEAQRLLSAALLERLPQYPASLALKRRLASQAAARRPARPAVGRRIAIATAALAAAILALVVPAVLHDRARAALATAALQEHLGVLRGEVPLAVVSSGIHEVKPWFGGKLDFSPAVSFGGDSEFPLQGGAVARFAGRPAALLQFKRRAHVISLFVVSAAGLSFPDAKPGAVRTLQGFHVLLWRGDDLGYTLVSDLNADELSTLAARLSGE